MDASNKRRYSIGVSASIQVNALHYWEDAPDHRRYLRSPHMHTFHILAEVDTTHYDREIEFHDLRDQLESVARSMLTNDDQGVPTFGGRSCEIIAQTIITRMPLELSSVSVSEDGVCAGRVSRTPIDIRHQVVTICGSTKFKSEFEDAYRTLTYEGHMVLSVGFFGHADNLDLSDNLKAKLDELHLSKIRASDWIYVVNPGGYIGESTQREIDLAASLGMPIIYREDKDEE